MLEMSKSAVVIVAIELTICFCDDLAGTLFPVQGSCVVHVWHMHCSYQVATAHNDERSYQVGLEHHDKNLRGLLPESGCLSDSIY